MTLIPIIAVPAVFIAWQIWRSHRRDRAAARAWLQSIEDRQTCERIWSTPAHDPELQAGLDRLRAAVRDEQKKEGEA